MGITFGDFSQDESIITTRIYGTSVHKTTSKGVVISEDIVAELQHFLMWYSYGMGRDDSCPPYYRIDAYFDQNTLWILEVNTAFVDGWGTALNLSRASGIEVDSSLLVFPRRFACEEDVYLPELQLFVSELAIRGNNTHFIVPVGNYKVPTYVYGRGGSKDLPNILPYNGRFLDNKIHLAAYNDSWKGINYFVRIPTHYTCRDYTWEQVPDDVVLKFCDKSGEECQKARQSVIIGKPSGKARFLRECFNEGKLLAQDRIEPRKMGSQNCQLVILAIGANPITGYVQYSTSQIINDNSVHGPLKLT